MAAALAACAPVQHVEILAAAPAPSTAVSYEVLAGPSARKLAVRAAIPKGFGDALVIAEGAADYVDDLEVDSGQGFSRAERKGDGWSIAPCNATGCSVRYRFRLADAAHDLDALDTARDLDGAFEAPAATYLARPRLPRERGAKFRFHVTTPKGVSYAPGVRPAPDGAKDTYEGDLRDLYSGPYSAFGSMQVYPTAVDGGAVLDIAIVTGKRYLTDAALVDWVKQAAHAVAGYYKRFPVPRALILIAPGGGRGVGNGQTLGDGAPAIVVSVGADTNEPSLARDWVLTHEMIHTSFPSLDRRHHWLEEGIATYVEPLARARAGTHSADRVWVDLVEGLPQGEPEDGDEGLDNTPTWGRTYWGGALFCFVADLQIRQATNNAKSLDDALRGILNAGGDGSVEWPIETTLSEGDRAIGVAVLLPLYRRMAKSPSPVDLDAIFRQLGVRIEAGKPVYDDGAPLAAIRKSMTRASN